MYYGDSLRNPENLVLMINSAMKIILKYVYYWDQNPRLGK